MKLKGEYAAGTSYSVGDVVRYTDGIAYHLQYPATAGTPPTKSWYWGRLDQRLGEAVCLMLDALEIALAAVDSHFIDANTLVLGTEGGTRYAVTVDDGELDCSAIVESDAT